MGDKNNNRGGRCTKGVYSSVKGLGFDETLLQTLGVAQLEILAYLCVDFKTIPQIAILRKTKRQAVYNIINKLKDKGLINNNYLPNIDIKPNLKSKIKKGGGYIDIHPANSEKRYRLHGQCKTLKILKTSLKYMKLLKKSQFPLEGNTVMIYRRKITIYSNTSFYAAAVDQCFIDSDVYWTRFFRILENKLGISLINGKYTSIYQFRCHIADTHSPLAKKVIKAKLKYAVIDKLGRLRLIIDNSKGLFEKEAVEHTLCGDDMKKLGNYELDIIEDNCLRPSEVKGWIENFKFALESEKSQHSEVLLMLKALTITVTQLKRER